MSKRKAGRPRGRQIVFRLEQLVDLPECGCMSRFAKVIGVSVSTLRWWISMQKCPAEAHTDRQGYTMHRDSFVRWLQSTGRVENWEGQQCANVNDVESASAAAVKPSIV